MAVLYIINDRELVEDVVKKKKEERNNLYQIKINLGWLKPSALSRRAYNGFSAKSIPSHTHKK